MTDIKEPGDNGGAPPEGGDPEDKPMTAKQFNAATTERERAFEKRLAKQQEEFKSILERFAPPQKEEPALSKTAENDKRIKDLEKQLSERDTREKNAHLYKEAEQSLKSHGIDAEFTDHALAFLVDAKKAVRYDDSGNLMMVLNGTEYSLDEGMAVWAQSRDAKLYKKPTGATGSGDGNRRALTEKLSKSGTLELTRKEGADKAFDPHNPRSSLDRASKILLSQLLAKKFSNQ